MPDKNWFMTITIYFLFKNWIRNSKYNVEISVDLTSRNHYGAERAIYLFMSAKVSFISAKATSNASQWLQNELGYIRS